MHSGTSLSSIGPHLLQNETHARRPSETAEVNVFLKATKKNQNVFGVVLWCDDTIAFFQWLRSGTSLSSIWPHLLQNETNKKRPSETAEVKVVLIALRIHSTVKIFPQWCCYLVLNITYCNQYNSTIVECAQELHCPALGRICSKTKQIKRRLSETAEVKAFLIATPHNSYLFIFFNALRNFTVQHWAAFASKRNKLKRPSETAEVKVVLIATSDHSWLLHGGVVNETSNVATSYNTIQNVWHVAFALRPCPPCFYWCVRSATSLSSIGPHSLQNETN